MLAVRPGRPGDLVPWLEIVHEVEPLFGPMPDFRLHAERGIARGTALVAVDDGDVHGACLLSRDDVPHEIRWLAVAERHRRRGAGSLLLESIENRWQTGDIRVVTFAPSVPGSAAARRLYESRGFELQGPATTAHDGSQRDLYVLPGARRTRR
jgi:GNAT superfamily N-acetyltransferase